MMSSYNPAIPMFGAALLYAATAMASYGIERSSSSVPRHSPAVLSGVGAARDWGTLSPKAIYGIREPIAMDYDQRRHAATNPTGYIGLGPFTPLSEMEKLVDKPHFSGTGQNYRSGSTLPGNFWNGYSGSTKASGCGKGGK